ncbi:MAG: DUF3833 family protein [Rhodobacteraceae bacterium]|nr:DUF3833 family protein [Paracoccaceae bacterium]
MKALVVILILLLIFVLLQPGLGFKSQKPALYAGTGPAFDIRQHLSGDIISEGMIYGPRGHVTSRFVAQMKGTWNGDTGTLSEDFTYDTGNTQRREWRLTMGENGAFTAEADDIIGIATGQHSGATVQMSYKIRLPEASGGHVLNVTDWLYLMENGTVLNRSELRKFGIKVAELVAVMRRVED